MSKRGAWLIFLGLALPLTAQEALPEREISPPPAVQEVLPDRGAVPPPVDLITPVPPPVIQFGWDAALPPVAPKNLKVDNFGGGVIEGVMGEGLRFLGPGVKVMGDNGLEVFADRMQVDLKAQTATLEGHVSVYQGNMLQRGDRAVYYYERKFLDASGLRASLDPLLLEAGKFSVEERGGKQVYVGEDAGITTDDAEEPNFWVRSEKTTIYPKEKIVFKDLKLYAGEVPVFWLPYLSQPLDAELGYHVIPGARSNLGVFVKNTYGLMLGGKRNETTGENEDAWLLSRWHLDPMSRRGVGLGVDLVDTREPNKKEITGLAFYYLNDLGPNISRSGVPRDGVDADRYGIELKHRLKLDFPDSADWRIDSNLMLLSDEYYLEDFSTGEYRTNPAPDHTVGIFRRDETSLFSLFGRFRLNDFYRADTRLPEVAFDQARRPFFGLPVLHEGGTSLAVIGEQAADPLRRGVLEPLLKLRTGDPAAQALLERLYGFDRQLAEKILDLPMDDPKREAIRNQLVDSSYVRFNTYQEWSLPVEVTDFLTVTPEAGVGYTSYGAVDGPVDNLDKTTLHAGLETSVKFSKDFGSLRSPRWGLDGLKHILQPYTHWSAITTNDFSTGDPQVDRLTPTTRPRPLDPTRFTAVDELQSWNVMRLGARNRLLTQRDKQTYEWLYVDTYVDAFLKDPEGKRDYSNLYNDVRWQPLPWLGVDFETQFPLVDSGSGFNEFTSRLRFMPTQDFEFSLGYRYLNGHPVLVDSSRLDLKTFTRINENWGIGSRHVWELDDRTVELEQFTLHRDLGNWVAGMGLTRRDNRLKEEYGVVFSLTLKDFPGVSLPLELDTQ